MSKIQKQVKKTSKRLIFAEGKRFLNRLNLRLASLTGHTQSLHTHNLRNTLLQPYGIMRVFASKDDSKLDPFLSLDPFNFFLSNEDLARSARSTC